ncbi:unnamed protein product (macronuclear) [Paramecium tetraurelia]|uniref:Uncharacterized protein n=1 Tax=Paramecium tetraurelia TaxID=5888 RepID=A0D3F3_PARTE|nr:uncharacterized protein GSPATT00013056001 [Paramecium tetraurelia]CAK77570.1 unnamed protein product [Paramecium tetraurelia]|eukprot:XP_001444967.1 hypothetical protein (macronuclear) [Paramecium tetraurelia strain d4-2]
MGNTNICCVEQIDEPFDKRKFLFHKKLNSLNNQLMTTIQYQDIIIFHKNVVAQLILNCSAPRLVSITEKDPETKLEFYARIKQEIELNQSNFFNLLIANYFLHFNEIYADEEVIDIIQQFDTISQMLRLVLLQGFQQDLKLYFGNDLDKLPEQELLVQRVLQHYLLGKTSPIKNKFNKMLNLYYQQIQYDELNQSCVPEKGTVLEQNDFEIDQALIPIQGGDIVNLSNDSFLESSGGSVKPTQQQTIIQIDNIIENAEKQFKHLPYATTFEILSQMIKTTKPWKKFLLIEKFDNLIIKTLLTNRDQSQLQSMQDILFAEDSRSDIYLYIFHSYGQQFKVDFKEHLLNSLKLMWEFDGLLGSDIKYIYCPCFLRFTNVLEMYVKSVSV